jgi:recombination protein RecA
MPAASAIRLQIESALAARIPAALTPRPRVVHPVAATGIEPLDAVLRGGLPLGAITELVGPECSGRTSVALQFVAGMTHAGRVCAWIDMSNAFDPPSAAATGVLLDRLLWVRCGSVQQAAPHTQNRFVLPEKYLRPVPAIKGLHGGGCGGHPRGEVNGLATAVSGLLTPKVQKPESVVKGRNFSRAEIGSKPEWALASENRLFNSFETSKPADLKTAARNRPGIWPRLDQALRATDLLLQAGGFSTIVLDLGSIAPEFASRVPLATWFRYRVAAERTQASILLLAQYGYAKSSAELSLHMQPGEALNDEPTVFTGMAHTVEVARRRFTGPADNVIPLRKPPQRANAASWQSHAPWAGVR